MVASFFHSLTVCQPLGPRGSKTLPPPSGKVPASCPHKVKLDAHASVETIPRLKTSHSPQDRPNPSITLSSLPWLQSCLFSTRQVHVAGTRRYRDSPMNSTTTAHALLMRRHKSNIADDMESRANSEKFNLPIQLLGSSFHHLPT